MSTVKPKAIYTNNKLRFQIKNCYEWFQRCNLLCVNEPQIDFMDNLQFLKDLMKDGLFLLKLLSILSNGELNLKTFDEYIEQPNSEEDNLFNITLFNCLIIKYFGISRSEIIPPNDIREGKQFEKFITLLSKISFSNFAQKSKIIGFHVGGNERVSVYGKKRSRISSDNPNFQNEMNSDKLTVMIVKELMESERLYVKQLRAINEDFKIPMSQCIEVEAVFPFIQYIYEIHLKILETMSNINIGKTISKEDCRHFCDIFIDAQNDLLIYCKYCESSKQAMFLVNSMMKKDAIRTLIENCVKETKQQEDGPLENRLDIPNRRITKYHTLLKFLQHIHLENEENYQSFSEALMVIENIVNYCDTVKKHEVMMSYIETIFIGMFPKGLPSKLNVLDLGFLHLEDEIKVLVPGSEEFRNRYIFVFDKACILTNKQENGYKFKNIFYWADEKPDVDYITKIIKVKTTDDKILTLSFTTAECIQEWESAIKLAISNMYPDGYNLNNHEFNMQTFVFMEKCFYCKQLIPGSYFQGYHCTKTRIKCHKECIPVTKHTEVGNTDLTQNSDKKTKKENLISEILETEYQHVELLYVLNNVYKVSLSNILCRDEIETIFKCVEELYWIHQKILLKCHIANIPGEKKFIKRNNLPNVFGDSQMDLLLYGEYCANIEAAKSCLSAVERSGVKNDELKKCQDNSKRFRQHKLNELLIRPLQRVTKYHLLFENLYRLEPENSNEYNDFLNAFEAMKVVAEFTNSVVKDSEEIKRIEVIQQRLNHVRWPAGRLLSDYGKLRDEGNVMISVDGQKRVKRYLIVLEQIICVTINQNENLEFVNAFYFRPEKPETVTSDDSENDKSLKVFVKTKKETSTLVLFFDTDIELNKWKVVFESIIDNLYPPGCMSNSFYFQIQTFKTVEKCYYCGKVLYGSINQGFFCKNNNIICHRECIPLPTEDNVDGSFSSSLYSIDSIEAGYSKTFFRFKIDSVNSIDLPVQCVPEELPEIEMNRDHCIAEIVSGELNFVKSIRELINNYRNPLENVIPKLRLDHVFLYIEQILKTHEGIYEKLHHVQICETHSTTFCRKLHSIFLEINTYLPIYGQYCSSLQSIQIAGQELVEEYYCLLTNTEKYSSKEVLKCNLVNLMLLPKKRIINYHLLLEKLLSKTSKEHPDYSGLVDAHQAMIELEKFVTDIDLDENCLANIDNFQKSITRISLPNNKSLKDYGRLQIYGLVLLQFKNDSVKIFRYLSVFDKILMIFINQCPNFEFETAYFIQNKKPQISINHEVQHLTIALYKKRNETTTIKLFFESERDCQNWFRAFEQAINNQYPPNYHENGYQFTMTTFENFAKCHFCERYLNGLFFQGYQCQKTKIISHGKCIPVKTHKTSISETGSTVSYSKESWFVGELDRDGANEMLKITPPGTFLIRLSNSNKRNGHFALSVMDKKARHIEIQFKNDQFIVNSDMKFSDLRELVKFFSLHPLNEYLCRFDISNLKLVIPVREVLPPFYLYDVLAIRDNDSSDRANVLHFRKNDVIKIISENTSNSDWLLGVLNNARGYIPKKYVKRTHNKSY